MKKKLILKALSNIWFIHSMVGLGLFALFGYIMLNNKFLLLGVYMSFSGAMCGAFIRIIDTINNKK